MPQVLKEEVRENILAAARVEFFEKGFDGGSIRSIAKLAGITPGNLYRYFASKEEIYETIVGPAYETFNRVIMKHTNALINMEKIPEQADYENIIQSQTNGEVIIKSIVGEIIDEFDHNRIAVLILLKDKKEEYQEAKFDMQKWFEAHFELMYRGAGIGKYLAHSFVEGLINIAIEGEETNINDVEKFVNFFFFKEAFVNEL